MKYHQWPKRDPDKNSFTLPNEVFLLGLSARRAGGVQFSTEHRRQRNLPVLAQYQDHRQGGGYE